MSDAITIQALDSTTMALIKEEAKQRGVSVETVILQLVHRGLESARRSRNNQTFHELDALAGTWSEEEASEFLNGIADTNSISEGLWRRDSSYRASMPDHQRLTPAK